MGNYSAALKKIFMTAQNQLNRPGQSYEGMVFHPGNYQELFQVIGMASDYRGDVTIKRSSGQLVTGYVFDRNEQAEKPYLRLFVENVTEPQMVPYEEIEELAFSGEDTAFGRSWEDWAKKWNKDPSAK